MSLFNFGDTNFEIKPTDTVWILAPGTSLDLFDFGKINPNHIVITVNAVLSVYNNPDFHIGSDGAAVHGYKDYYKQGTIWISKACNYQILQGYKIRFLSMVDLIADIKFKGSGSDAFLLAYYLCFCEQRIKRVNVVGLDSSDLSMNGFRYYYANRVKVLDWQKTTQAPSVWWKKNHKIVDTNFNSYQAQRRTIIDTLAKVPTFRQLLFSYSFFDWKTNHLRADVNYLINLK